MSKADLRWIQRFGNFKGAFAPGAVYVFFRTGTNWTQQAFLNRNNAVAGWVEATPLHVGCYFQKRSSERVLKMGSAGVSPAPVGDSPTGTSVVRRDKQIASYLQITSPTFRPAGRRTEQASGLCHPNRILRHGLSRNDAVENGDRMRPACCRRRRAVGFVLTNLPTGWWRAAVGEKFAARRRKPHARGVWSPFSTASFRLKASNPDQDDHFGFAVAGAGHTIVIGARDEDSNGDEADNTSTHSGAAYVFTRTGTNWIQSLYLKASNPGGGNASYELADGFGTSVAISGGSLAIGAPGEASNATGVNGNQNDNSLPLAGAAYVIAGLGSVPPVSLEMDYAGDTLHLSWAGAAVLEAAPFVTGPWLPVTNAVSLHLVGPTNQQHYFRLLLPEP